MIDPTKIRDLLRLTKSHPNSSLPSFNLYSGVLPTYDLGKFRNLLYCEAYTTTDIDTSLPSQIKDSQCQNWVSNEDHYIYAMGFTVTGLGVADSYVSWSLTFKDIDVPITEHFICKNMVGAKAGFILDDILPANASLNLDIASGFGVAATGRLIIFAQPLA